MARQTDPKALDAELEETMLAKCLELIEAKLNWGPSANWRNHDFLLLIDKVHEMSGIKLSLSTIRRLYGRVRFSGTPQPKTLDALAIFLGYQHFKDFIAQNHDAVKNNPEPLHNPPEPLQPNPTVPHKKNHFRLALIIAVVLVLFMGWFVAEKLITPKANIEFKLSTPDTVIGPTTAIFDYKINKLGKTDLLLDLGDIYAESGKVVKLNAQAGRFTHNYIIPYLYKIHLLSGNDTLFKGSLLVKTNGWFSNVAYHSDLDKVYHYIPTKGAIDSVNHRLHLPPDQVFGLGIFNTRYYWTEFRNVGNFNANANNMIWQSVVENKPEDGGNHCYDVILIAITEKMPIQVNLTAKGCTRWAQIKLGEVATTGADHDLSALGVDFGYKRTVKLQTADTLLTIAIDNQNIYQCAIDPNLGRLLGLIYVFKGCGSVYSAQILNRDADTVFTDNFGQ